MQQSLGYYSQSIDRNNNANQVTQWYPSYSSDGQKIVFAQRDDQSDDQDFKIYIMNIDGTGLTRLEIAGSSYEPSW